VDFSLTPDQVDLQERARAIARGSVAPRASLETFDLGLVKELGRAGLLSLEYGDTGSALIGMELGRVDSSVRGFVTVQTGLVASCIAQWGTSAQKERWLPGLTDGSVIGCYALTEPGAGSDARAITTRAQRTGAGWELDGVKHWITNGNVADIAIVFANADAGLTAFLVPTHSAGFTRERMPGGELGHRGSDHSRFTFHACNVNQTLGDPGQGFTVAMDALKHGRLGVAAGAVGILQACLEASVSWARSRRQFGKRIGDFEMVQADLADMAVYEAAARSLVMTAAWMADSKRDNSQAVAIAKLFATEAAQRAAEKAVIIHGARGYSSEYPVERHYRDVIGMQIYEGTPHIQRLIIARELLGRDVTV
jgi:alkylation response protein AidB-like acyl-CoA dehydrogenase